AGTHGPLPPLRSGEDARARLSAGRGDVWAPPKEKAARWGGLSPFAWRALFGGCLALHREERLHRVVHRLDPRRVMHGRHRPGAGRFERLVAVAEDRVDLVV